jgi:hypothetical protein
MLPVGGAAHPTKQLPIFKNVAFSRAALALDLRICAERFRLKARSSPKVGSQPLATETAIRIATSQIRIGTLEDSFGCGWMTLAEFMLHQLLNDDQGRRTLAPLLQFGDKARGCLQDFTRSNTVAAAQLTGIGRLSDVVLSPSGQRSLHARVRVATRRLWARSASERRSRPSDTSWPSHRRTSKGNTGHVNDRNSYDWA